MIGSSTKHQARISYRARSSQCVLIALLLALVPGCARIDRGTPPGGAAVNRHEQAMARWFARNGLAEIDAVVKLNNEVLERHMRKVFLSAGQVPGEFEFTGVEFGFGRQHIALRADVKLHAGDHDAVPARLHGDALLAFSGDRVFWLPGFDRLEFLDPAMGESGAAGMEEQASAWLDRINARVSDRAVINRVNSIGLAASPLGSLELGAALPDFPGATAQAQFPLWGSFAVAGSATLIEETHTSVALDLEFVRGVLACSPEMLVSRSAFVDHIVQREPRGVLRESRPGKAEFFYFTEILNTPRPATIVHYWLADGRAVNVTELAVEPSARWRTWSSVVADGNAVRNWQVIVADKESGCIIDSGALSVNSAGGPIAAAAALSDREAFDAYRREFQRQVSDFSVLEEAPDTAVIELSRAFFRSALNASLEGRQFAVQIDTGDPRQQRYSGSLTLSHEDMACELRSCAPQRECTADFSRCERRMDTRDCRSCRFHNPLNNRCIRESVDPVCEQIKANRNRDYALEWESCLAEQEAEQLECQRADSRELLRCENDAEAERAACESRRSFVEQLPEGTFMVDVQGEIFMKGEVSVIYSNVQINGDFEKVRADVSFEPDLELRGAVDFSATDTPGPMAACFAAWSRPLAMRLTRMLSASRRVGTFRAGGNALVVEWPEFDFVARSGREPLSVSLSGHNPSTADCQMGLSAEKIAAALSGQARDLLTGSIALAVRPLASHFTISSLSADVGDVSLGATPQLTARHVRYEVTK